MPPCSAWLSAFPKLYLPGRDPQNLVVVSSVNPDATFQADTNPVSAPNYLAWKNETGVFSAMAAAGEYRTGSLSGPGQQPDAISYAAVSADAFTVFGISPQLGRAFLSGEISQGATASDSESRPVGAPFCCGSFDRRKDRAPQPGELRGCRCDARNIPLARIHPPTLDAPHPDSSR